MNKTLVPSIGLVIGGVLWGLFWIPLRALDDQGVSGGWPITLIYIAILPMLLPVFFFRPKLVQSPLPALIKCGLFTGTAFALYSISLFFTDVVRVLLLFYLTPVWSTLMGYFLLGESIGKTRLLAIVLGLVGLVVILGLGEQFPWPRNIGDWLALISGISWAYGSVCIYQLKSSTTFEQMLVFVVGGLFVSLCAILFGGSLINKEISLPLITSAIPLVILSALFILPMIFLTVWPARVLSPGRVGLLLMSEVVVGVGSAALLTGEPFGMRETIGTALVISAGLVEVLGSNSNA